MTTTTNPKRPPQAAAGALGATQLRYQFYRDGFRMAVTASVILSVGLLVALAVIAYLASRPPKNTYFSVDPAGRVVKMTALSSPYVNSTFIQSWVADRVSRAYAMDPKNYRTQVAELAGDFTPDGFESYKASLEKSGIIDFMTKNFAVSSAVPTGTPLIAQEGELSDGTYHWRVRVPMLVEYKSASKTSPPVRRVVEVLVVRRHTIEAPLGIGIAQFVAVDA